MPKKTKTIADAFDDYRDVTDAILDDYVADDKMILELGQADKNLEKTVTELFDKKEIEGEELLALVKSKLSEGDIDADDLISIINADKKNVVTINIQTLDQEEKLKHFIETELYPHYNERMEYSLL